MANTLATNDDIGKIALAAFSNALGASMTANTNYVDAIQGARRGAQIRIDKPLRTTVRTGATASVQDITQQTDTFAITEQAGIDFTLSTLERSFSIDKLHDQILQPMMQRLANKVDQDGVLQMEYSAYHAVGTAGTALNSFASVNNGRAKLEQYGVPDAKYVLMNPIDGISVQNALQNSFNTMLNKNISEQGTMGNLAGLDVYRSANVYQHIKGVATGTPLVNGASQTGSSLVTDGWTILTTGILKKGDIITLAGVFGVNPTNQTQVGTAASDLQQFVVTADVNSDGSGNATIPISPPITTTTAYQTVSGSPADNAAITVVDSYNQNFMYSQSGLSLACVDPGVTEGAPYSRTFAAPNGLVLRLNQSYNISTDVVQLRFDVFYAWKAFGEYICKLLG